MAKLDEILRKYFPRENPAVSYDRLLELVDDLYELTECFDDFALKNELKFYFETSNMLVQKFYDLEEHAAFRELKRLEKYYGAQMFRYGIRHLVDVGRQALADRERVELVKESLMEQGDSREMTASVKCRIVDCASEISDVDVDYLLQFVKSEYVG